MKELQELFEVVPIFGSLHDYSQERLRLEKLGKRLPDFDLLIATTALTHDLIMVTNNENHLGRRRGPSSRKLDETSVQ